MHAVLAYSFHCVWSFFVFFFFKQKTAYEMRISDWSSDVCSSDLAQRRHAGLAQPLAAALGLLDDLGQFDLGVARRQSPIDFANREGEGGIGCDERADADKSGPRGFRPERISLFRGRKQHADDLLAFIDPIGVVATVEESTDK